MLTETQFAVITLGILFVALVFGVTMLVASRNRCGGVLDVAAYDDHPDTCGEADYCPRCDMEADDGR